MAEMANLFGSEVEKNALADAMEHINSCPSCSEEYRRTQKIFTMLTPKFHPQAPSSLKQNIFQQLNQEELRMKPQISKTVKISSRYKKAVSLAAVLLIALLIGPLVNRYKLNSSHSAKAAGALIESSIKASQLVNSFAIELNVRTLEDDNFALIGTEYGMVGHKIWKTFKEPICWRIEKSKRIAVSDGKSLYLWSPKTELALKSGTNANFTEWFRILLEPEKILAKEQEGIKTNGWKFSLNEKDGELKLSINSKAQGNFINDYCKNKSIDESDNRREYTFDSSTKLLKALKIFVIEGKRETQILEIKKIDYNIPIDAKYFTIELPQGLKWQEVSNEANSEHFKNISSKKAAELFLEGMANKDWTIVKETCRDFENSSSKTEELKKCFGGLCIIKIGEPFKSGLYPGEFVPYIIKLPSGEIKKMNLALRNDNNTQSWMVDGGF